MTVTERIREDIRKRFEDRIFDENIVINEEGDYYCVSAGLKFADRSGMCRQSYQDAVYSLDGEVLIDFNGYSYIKPIDEQNFYVVHLDDSFYEIGRQHFHIEDDADYELKEGATFDNLDPDFNLAYYPYLRKIKIKDKWFLYNINNQKILSLPFADISKYFTVDGKTIDLAEAKSRLVVSESVYSSNQALSTTLVGTIDFKGNLVRLIDGNTLEEYPTVETVDDWNKIINQVEATLNGKNIELSKAAQIYQKITS